jgi:1-deoxyxylulose-5-phosphate synthase
MDRLMNTVKFGRTGLEVTPLCLGCMSYGEPKRGSHEWTLDEAGTRPFIRRAIELGLNFFDTADAYSDGTSEEIAGRLLREYGKRDELVVATKVFFRSGGPNTGGLSRKAIFRAIDASLRRLGMDHVDLYQIHRFDAATPIEETLEALNDVVKAGKARYLGASSMFAWQFMKMLGVAKANGWQRFVSMQNHLNLLYREEEREMLPLCREEGIAVIPWSPLARGQLTRAPGTSTPRGATDAYQKRLYASTTEADTRVIAAVQSVATARGIPMAQVALAWLMGTPGVTAPIIGATKPHHLEDAVAALAIQLSADERAALEAPYIPHAIAGHE